jgi:hypothetical protein
MRQCIPALEREKPDWKAPPANDNGGKNLPPLPVAECLRRHVHWREVPRGGFFTFRQATFSNKI